MRNSLVFSLFLGSLLTGAYALTAQAPTAEAGGPKNLKVYPKNTDKKTIKKDMKAISKALGVQCDFCHDMSALEKDTKMKEVARKMMRMTNEANKSLKKGGFKQAVTCNTCHAGNKEPKR